MDLPKEVSKYLANTNYERRKLAALTLENTTRKALQSGKEEVIIIRDFY